jgi:Asp-tRNA(Asn)/Glu-tRNA(Gln) amidotransferase B subunit
VLTAEAARRVLRDRRGRPRRQAGRQLDDQRPDGPPGQGRPRLSTPSPIPPADIAALVKLIEDGVVSSKIAKVVFDHMWDGEGAPAAIVEKHGLVQVTDTGAIEAAVDKIIAANPGQVAAVKDKPQAIGWFVGQVMRPPAARPTRRRSTRS